MSIITPQLPAAEELEANIEAKKLRNWEIDSGELNLATQLGEGEYGMVIKDRICCVVAQFVWRCVLIFVFACVSFLLFRNGTFIVSTLDLEEKEENVGDEKFLK